MCSSDLSSASRFGKEVPRFQYGKLRGIINILPVDKYLLALAVDTYLLSINLIDIPAFMFVIAAAFSEPSKAAVLEGRRFHVD